MGSQRKATFVSYEQQITSFNFVFNSSSHVDRLRNATCIFNLDISRIAFK
ncbi:hypothetical protein GRS44_12510 [Vibrio alginolyticus]|nr:hypothetical protein [Vibrio alginolyticus]EGR2324886.1 hypothetical protein [Vibrio alginolyticus]NNN42651.1 hypothetical protein [Vibrio sp. 2-2(2)]NNO05720.1 hypothetical protein [Vibrio sp. 7-5(1-a)]